jgi:uncharacterized protein (DUF486 family)
MIFIMEPRLITFVVFAGFSYLYLQEPITLSQVVSH